MPGEAWACAGFVPPASAGAADSVGAGDAFLAGLLLALLGGDASPAAALQEACRVGAYVAGAPGATPRLEPREIAALLPREAAGDGCLVVPPDLMLGR